MNTELSLRHTNFIDPEKLKTLASIKAPTPVRLQEILNRALELQGLSITEVAELLQADDQASIQKLLEAAGKVKEEIYGKRLVIFAPLYTGNRCSNNCLYCGFRAGNTELKRLVLSQDQIRLEVESLLKDGHKRLLMLCGESRENPLDYFVEAIRTAYAVQVGKSSVRRINVEIAPMEIENFRRLKAEKIGTYVCFQETYDPELYKVYHPTGPKKDYLYRLTVMDRAMEAGIDDVGIGVLFGLADYKFEVLAIMEHARHLEEAFGCGPHTVSVPRLEPAEGAVISEKVPYPVSDDNFKKIVAIIRLALPYTGIILSTREGKELRNELFQYGISQISAGSRTNPGAYSDAEGHSGAQFSLGDHRSMEEVILELIDHGYIPSFCTGCYRKGRVGHDFMDLAKPGLIKEFCMPNAVFTFKEYLEDFAGTQTKAKGLALVDQLVAGVEKKSLRQRMKKNLLHLDQGSRDVYF